MTYDEEKVVLDLLREAFSFRYSDAKALLNTSSLALELVVARNSNEPIALDLEGYCRAHVGNAHRILGRLREARQELNTARDLLERGTGRLSFLAELYRFQASLEESGGDFAAAEEAINKAEQLYAILGDTEGIAACCVKRAIVFIYSDRPQDAFATILGAVQSIENEDLLRSAYETAIRALVDAGEIASAMRVLEMSRSLFAGGGDLFQLKVLWLEGQATGRRSRLAQARKGYSDRGMIFQAALISLEEAAMAVREAELSEARDLLDVAGPVLAALGIVKDSLAAMILDLDVTRREELERAEAILLGFVKQARLHRPANG
jgi:tetratricopeptide (TPR) repeat protein